MRKKNIITILKREKIKKVVKKDYSKIKQKIQALCKEKKFREVRKVMLKEKLPRNLKRAFYKIIQKEEKEVLKYFANKKGWFGEKLIKGMKVLPDPGEYEWQKDFSIMVFVPKGSFIRGSKSKKDTSPVRRIGISSFYIDKYELTNKSYKSFIRDTGHQTPKYMKELGFNNPNHPVVGINWYDAMKYAKWAGKKFLPRRNGKKHVEAEKNSSLAEYQEKNIPHKQSKTKTKIPMGKYRSQP